MNSLVTKSFICVAICLGLGFASGISTGLSDMSWYDALVKPSFNPPSWIFGPAWTLLYILMGVAVAKIWHHEGDTAARSSALKFFIIQMIYNLSWTPMFFSLKRMDVALFLIICLWLLILVTIMKFRKLNKMAAYLLVPYLLWVTFATVLNASLLYLNQ